MSAIIRILFLIGFVAALGGKVFGAHLFETTYEDIEPGSPDQFHLDEYDTEGFWPPLVLKRAGFWSPHPSDLNPMRRPGSISSQGPRSTAKKSEIDNPYHPVPRSVNQKQKGQTGMEDLEQLLEGIRDKRQSPGSFLLMKLGRGQKTAEPQTRRMRRPYPNPLKP